MKIKGKYNIRPISICIVSIVSAAVLCVLRFIQVKNYVEPETGFSSGGGALNIVFYLILALTAVFCIVASFLSKGANSFEPGKYKAAVPSIFTLLAALGFLADAVQYGLPGTASSQAEYLQSAVVVMKVCGVIRLVFALLSAVYFFVLFSDEIRGKAKTEKLKLLALAPSVWALSRIITLFTTKLSYIRVSDLLLQIIYISFLILFLIVFSHQKSGIYSDGTAWKLFAYGATAAAIIIPVMLCRFAFGFIDGGNHLLPDYPFYSADLTLALFILAFLFGKKKYIAEETENVVESGPAVPVEAEADAGTGEE